MGLGTRILGMMGTRILRMKIDFLTVILYDLYDGHDYRSV